MKFSVIEEMFEGVTKMARCAIAEHPQLLERPIAVVGDKAAIGRPLDNIAALLDMSV